MLITLFTVVRFTSQMPTHPFFPGMFLILALAIKVITRAPTPVRVMPQACPNDFGRAGIPVGRVIYLSWFPGNACQVSFFRV